MKPKYLLERALFVDDELWLAGSEWTDRAGEQTTISYMDCTLTRTLMRRRRLRPNEYMVPLNRPAKIAACKARFVRFWSGFRSAPLLGFLSRGGQDNRCVFLEDGTVDPIPLRAIERLEWAWRRSAIKIGTFAADTAAAHSKRRRNVSGWRKHPDIAGLAAKRNYLPSLRYGPYMIDGGGKARSEDVKSG